MLLLALPLLLNPFGMIIRWLPALYLAAWPIIIQTLGRDALILQAILLIMFILTCDITREMMLRLIGFDLISLPAGVLLLSLLLTDKGSSILSIITPICTTLLIVIEPVFLFLESVIILEMIKAFNKWMGTWSNVRDDDPHDLSSWEPPLSRGSMFMRFVVILITIASYIGTYLLVQEAKTLLGINEKDIPVQFNHAIALLVTLQLIAFTATIYKEEGILSESAMVALIASVPIFVAGWSYNHLKTEVDLSTSWKSYFPFRLFSWPDADVDGSFSASEMATSPSGRGQRIVFGDYGQMEEPSSFGGAGFQRLDFGLFEESVNLFAPTNNFVKKALLNVSRQLIMLINSILGLSMDKLAKYYFGPDFWYILAARLLCLVWWLVYSGRSSTIASDCGDQAAAVLGDDESCVQRLLQKWRRFNSWLPINKRTLIKILFVLAYAQMLVQQIENKRSLADQGGYQLLLADVAGQLDPLEQIGSAGSCCGSSRSADGGQETSAGLLDSSTSWLSCMWTSAKACSQATGRGSGESTLLANQRPTASRATRSMEALLGFCGQLVAFLLSLVAYAYNRLTSLHSSLYAAYVLWLLRWRSPIIQRLMQSVFIQLYYICSLALTGDSDDLTLANEYL